ncbi:HNH endonuclease signature motif containing protein [Chelativorans sp.]|uniref:HNH endonuclease n=1 Tax=Chelativorans sp. TaxID=2203393 RepID=UPI0028122A5A|nr:HNH endonuclease signature motif containing protein [Chelativorans sp.]
MARLRTVGCRIGLLPSRLGLPGRDEKARTKHRDSTQPWRGWYKTARWQKLRWSVLVRDLFTCQRCGKIEVNTSRLVADHKVPHHGDERLFWDDQNLQCLCKLCHDSVKQSEERGAAVR